MRSSAGGLPLFLLLPLLAACPTAQPQGAAETRVHAAVAAYDSAWNRKDTAAVAALMTPEYTYFTSLGGLSDRAQSLKDLADPAYVLTEVRRSEVTVVVLGDVARVSSRWEGIGSWKGGLIRDDQTCGQHWVLRQSHWRLFSEHCVNRPPPAAP